MCVYVSEVSYSLAGHDMCVCVYVHYMCMCVTGEE